MSELEFLIALQKKVFSMKGELFPEKAPDRPGPWTSKDAIVGMVFERYKGVYLVVNPTSYREFSDRKISERKLAMTEQEIARFRKEFDATNAVALAA